MSSLSGAADHEKLDRKRRLAVALKKARSQALRNCFDPQDLESRPTPAQEEVLRETLNPYLFQFVRGGNQSGKTQTAARIMAWFFQGYHPYLDLQSLWPDEPIVMLMVGRIINQMEEIWARKIKPYLNDDEYQEFRPGGTLQYVVNPKNGHKIIFCSHQNPNEAREKVQSYSLHMAWLDELTDSVDLIEEIQRRVMLKRGAMLITFTPKIKADRVRKFLETPSRVAKTYNILMLDNPAYADRKQEVLEQLNGLSETQRRTILYGDWYVGDRCVYNYDSARHRDATIPGYSTLWPHVVVVDPAASGLMGLSVWAAPDTHSHTWWCVKAKYLKGGAPTELIEKVEAEVAPYQIVYRVSDEHEAWWIKENARRKIFYRTVPKKDRKKELITQLNEALLNRRMVLTSEAMLLEEELNNAQWSETQEDRIVNASSYHLADTAQYFADTLPKVKSTPEHVSFDAQLREANRERKRREAAKNDKKRQAFMIVAKRGRVWKRSA